MTSQPSSDFEPMPTRRSKRERARGLFSSLKIRKKLIVLHTSFSIALGALLLIALSPAMGKMVDGAEQDQAELFFERSGVVELPVTGERSTIQTRLGDAELFELLTTEANALVDGPERVIEVRSNGFGAGIVMYVPELEQFYEVRSRSERARKLVQLVYGLVIVTMFAGYAFVAVALEVLVLPQHVYTPIQALLDADDASRSRDVAHELVPEAFITSDELGEIMRSRNDTVRQLRTHEQELADTLARLESVAIDLHKKNRLLETARKNLEGADRLASLGMMSAGIAHELNTPLSVVKGLVNTLDTRGSLSESEQKLLVRVVGRIEILSEGLLDFARVRTPRLESVQIHDLVNEAWTMIKLDRQVLLPNQQVEFRNQLDEGLAISCDSPRMIQVFVNLIRNAVHALRTIPDHDGQITVSAKIEQRDDGEWVVISIADNGPGIDPAIVDSLFEPFVSSRLDAQGTGLGLAVADGIVREHGGLVVPSNLVELSEDDDAAQAHQQGALFEIHMPR